MQEIAPGLTYWSTAHPEWQPDAEPESVEDWPQQVGSIAVDLGDSVALIDALVEDWSALDALVAGRRVHALTTIRWHRRNTPALFERYRADAMVPDGIEALRLADEIAYYVRAHDALVLGDRIIGDGDGGVRLCPASWLPGGTTLDDVRADLPALSAEILLVTHGDPLLAGGREALSALAGS